LVNLFWQQDAQQSQQSKITSIIPKSSPHNL
jgi:hypothetical protein